MGKIEDQMEKDMEYTKNQMESALKLAQDNAEKHIKFQERTVKALERIAHALETQ